MTGISPVTAAGLRPFAPGQGPAGSDSFSRQLETSKSQSGSASQGGSGNLNAGEPLKAEKGVLIAGPVPRIHLPKSPPLDPGKAVSQLKQNILNSLRGNAALRFVSALVLNAPPDTLAVNLYLPVGNTNAIFGLRQPLNSLLLPDLSKSPFVYFSVPTPNSSLPLLGSYSPDTGKVELGVPGGSEPLNNIGGISLPGNNRIFWNVRFGTNFKLPSDPNAITTIGSLNLGIVNKEVTNDTIKPLINSAVQAGASALEDVVADIAVGSALESEGAGLGVGAAVEVGIEAGKNYIVNNSSIWGGFAWRADITANGRGWAWANISGATVIIQHGTGKPPVPLNGGDVFDISKYTGGSVHK